MPIFTGRDASLECSAVTAPNVRTAMTRVYNLTEFRIDDRTAVHDVVTITARDSDSASVRRVKGLDDWTLTASGYYDRTESVQQYLQPGREFHFVVHPEKYDAKAARFTGVAILQNFEPSGSATGLTEFSVTFEGNGVLDVASGWLKYVPLKPDGTPWPNPDSATGHFDPGVRVDENGDPITYNGKEVPPWTRINEDGDPVVEGTDENQEPIFAKDETPDDVYE